MCVSQIPNPLFDLAGVACGAFGVSFWTFFGATVVGKAFFKAHGQSAFVVLIASELQYVAHRVRSLCNQHTQLYVWMLSRVFRVGVLSVV